MSGYKVSGMKLAPGECIPSKAQRILQTNVLYQFRHLCVTVTTTLATLKHWHFKRYSGHLSSLRRSSRDEEKLSLGRCKTKSGSDRKKKRSSIAEMLFSDLLSFVTAMLLYPIVCCCGSPIRLALPHQV